MTTPSDAAAALEMAARIADKWCNENKAAAAKARKSISEGSRNMAEMLDGAAIECNAIAQEIRTLAATLAQPVEAMDATTVRYALEDLNEVRQSIEAFPSNLGEVEGRITERGARHLHDLGYTLKEAHQTLKVALAQTRQPPDEQLREVPTCLQCGGPAPMSNVCHSCETGDLFDLPHLAYRLRTAMADANLSYRAAEPLIKVDHNTLQRVATATRPPTVENFMRIEKWLCDRALGEGHD